MSIKAYFIDIQGTLLSDVDKGALSGAVELIDHFNAISMPYVLVTNNTKQKSSNLVADLQSKGFALSLSNYIDPMMVLSEVVGNKSVYPFGAEQFCDLVVDMGFQISQKPEAILIASYDKFNSSDYAKMIDLVFGGAQIIALHATSTYAKGTQRYPGVGAILAMLSYATGKSGQVVGKPSELFYNKAKDILKQANPSLQKGEICFVSDDALGDLVGAFEQGYKTALVLSGKCKSEYEILHVKRSIGSLYKGVWELLEELR